MPYKDPEKHKAYHRAYNAKYCKTEKNKECQKRYHEKKAQAGLCRICSLPIFKARLCEKHYHLNIEKLAKHTKAKTEFVRSIKLQYGCSNPACAWNALFLPFQLEFHHLDSSLKSGNIGTGQKSIAWTIREMNKCCVLCSNCHNAVTCGELNCNNFVKCNISIDGKIIKTL